ncbi:membrane-spanning 4-domains subfamily A member 4D-like isoform X1 [Panthera leo]|uniref:membrane-spanning 4-domains subfamily A member 4D-like isoform X1 n=1 Tax=Panthera leo TaxID=9689 RepID=UPI001C696D3F|nr:membrane-spanning 4-domains subfamily A member 4D-like isoform X1 [Panthera leo]XP_042761516.1 membrane-spanning 4-domains subfamily A member 4D-like isoform X1 [Panthera leo]XP_042761518.1 membrane-spanning 4-domains subfamily A member 4D-like isoform X1 [Panthera leo]XP_042761519.1 membrane-spanning 4-domains subfamily A member 4D-like isoform X1 [Panthera leo]
MGLQRRDPAIYLGQSGPMPLPQEAQSNLQNFLKGEPVILGVSQIVIGLMNICLWIMVKVFLSFHKLHLFLENTVYTFIFLLGPIFLIISGTMSIASGKKTTKKMICSSLGTNTLAAILAGVSLIILAIRTEASSHFLSETVLARYFLIGIMIMKLILIILGLIVSVLLSAFGCSAVCCDVTSVVVDLSSNDCGVAVASLYHYYDDVALQHA